MKCSIQIKQSTKEKLSSFGTLAETYDSVINDLIDHALRCQLFNKEKNLV
ncbi:hypothetical protein [Nitrosarchaeum sp. AC2]|nr:hypothetical protein [Nitrosarchaeum sp. AC2]